MNQRFSAFISVQINEGNLMTQPTILIVDDEPFNVDYLEQELEELNYETIAATNGQEALDKIQAEQPDLVLLDIMMPVMDGFAVLERVKANPRLRDIPIIVISAMSDLENVIKKVDVLLVNDSEARQLSAEYSLVKAARVILNMGPKYLIIKKGEHGALLFHGNDVFFAPALPLEDVFDPTGAGDTFAGGFIGHIAKTNDISFENMKTAIIVGSAMASFCVEKFGTTRLKEIKKADIDERIQQFVQLVNFDIKLI